VFGRGFLKSDQKMNRLPLSTKDFVYPVMVEELGYVGGVAIILLFLYIAFVGLQLSLAARDPFNQVVIAALGFGLCLQAFINIGTTIGTLPLSGLTLPFFSEGGTSLVVSLAAIGLMYALGRCELIQARAEARQGVLQARREPLSAGARAAGLDPRWPRGRVIAGSRPRG
jgi:cell division protein FtsW